MIFAPPSLDQLDAGTKLVAGMGESVILADFDFETYSPAGFVWNPWTNKFDAPPGASKKGLQVTGVARYSEHPDAEVLCLAYDLKNGDGRKLWVPGQPDPVDLLNHILLGRLIEAWNVGFEYWIWTNICVPKYGWPPLSQKQIRCAAAKARAFGLPGSLDPCGQVMDITKKKDKAGSALIQKFCVPRNPTKYNASRRNMPVDSPLEQTAFYNYCLRDIEAEAELSSRIPDLNEFELEFWQCDQIINKRGVQIDIPLIDAAIRIVKQAHTKYNLQLYKLTAGKVKAASEIAKLAEWVRSMGLEVYSLSEDNVETLLKEGFLINSIRRALEIRQLIGSASVKKLYSMKNQVSRQGRLHDLFIYHSARTGRAAGSGPQPQNLPNSGPAVSLCVCNRHFVPSDTGVCPWCYRDNALDDIKKSVEWNPKAVDDALEVISSGSLSMLEHYFGDAMAAISGCLRGLFISKPGHDLICSDYSAIEAVVLAALAGEEWRLDVFRTHGKIYEMSASKISGVPFEDFERHKANTGQHHPLRKTIGKVAELASGYQGWLGAWKAFGADAFFSDEEIKTAVLAWRDASPKIVQFWYGLEKAAHDAVKNPGCTYSYNGINYVVRQNVLYCKLLSGRYLCYHNPQLRDSERKYGALSLSFEGWNTNPTKGAMGWVRMDTYGGKLCENVVQATARDILAHAIVNLENGGYPVVLHVHDEIVVEVPEGRGSVEEVERIMATMPEWAKDWPLKASGGWRAKRYAK